MFKIKKQVNKTERLSYFLVQLALKSAYVSPLPPPPTFSSVFQLSEINKKIVNVRKRDLLSSPPPPPHKLFPHVLIICTFISTCVPLFVFTLKYRAFKFVIRSKFPLHFIGFYRKLFCKTLLSN